MSVARAQFDDAPRILIRQIFFQHAGHDARMPHPGVDSPEVTARAQGGLILRRQRVEEFGKDDTFHVTSKRINKLIHFQQRAVTTEAGAE